MSKSQTNPDTNVFLSGGELVKVCLKFAYSMPGVDVDFRHRHVT